MAQKHATGLGQVETVPGTELRDPFACPAAHRPPRLPYPLPADHNQTSLPDTATSIVRLRHRRAILAVHPTSMFSLLVLDLRADLVEATSQRELLDLATTHPERVDEVSQLCEQWAQPTIVLSYPKGPRTPTKQQFPALANSE